MTDAGAIRWRCGWARVAGLLYWLVLIVDLSGMQVSAPGVGSLLLLAGSVLTVPLALGLYFAVRPAGVVLAGVALACRLVEALVGVLSNRAVEGCMAGSGLAGMLLAVARWNDRTVFGAFIFTVGSTIFFWLFWRSRAIPRVLAGLGLVASVVALVACSVHLARPGFPAMTIGAWLPLLVAEPAVGAWLLVRAVR